MTEGMLETAARLGKSSLTPGYQNFHAILLALSFQSVTRCAFFESTVICGFSLPSLSGCT